MNKRKKVYITNKNRAALIDKASTLCNAGLSLKRVLQRCGGLSYRQLYKLSLESTFTASVLFGKPYDSDLWCSNQRTQLNREFAVRGHALGLKPHHIAFLLGRSTRTIYRYIETQKNMHKQTKT